MNQKTDASQILASKEIWKNRLLTFAVILLIVSFALLRLSLTNELDLNWDFPILVDGVWRLTHGQLAMHDYRSPIGPFAFIPGTLGVLLLGKPTLFAINFGFVLFGTIVSITMLFVLKFLRNLLTASLTAVTVALLLLTPRTMNYETNYLSYTGWYNSIGISFLIFAFIIIFSVETEDTSKRLIVRGAILGVISVVLLLLKWTYVLPVIAASGVYVFCEHIPISIGNCS